MVELLLLYCLQMSNVLGLLIDCILKFNLLNKTKLTER